MVKGTPFPAESSRLQSRRMGQRTSIFEPVRNEGTQRPSHCVECEHRFFRHWTPFSRASGGTPLGMELSPCFGALWEDSRGRSQSLSPPGPRVARLQSPQLGYRAGARGQHEQRQRVSKRTSLPAEESALMAQSFAVIGDPAKGKQADGRSPTGVQLLG